MKCFGWMSCRFLLADLLYLPTSKSEGWFSLQLFVWSCKLCFVCYPLHMVQRQSLHFTIGVFFGDLYKIKNNIYFYF